MIKEKIKIHDRYQFEVKLDYPHEERTYSLETYFFFPKALGINKHTYTKQDFYKDIQTYIRYKTPQKTLRSIATDIAPRLQERLKSAHPKRELKLFCCMVKSAARDDFNTPRYLDDWQDILRSWRALRIDPPLEKTYRACDEHLSLLFEHFAHRLYSKRRHKNILTAIKKEMRHRKEQGYPSVPHPENTDLLLRKSLLKKYVSTPLYLETKTQKAGTLAIELAFAIAAGIAMIFATTIAFVSQASFGNLSLPFFTALVIGYVFKDRIKDSARAYLKGKVLDKLDDQQHHIIRGKTKIGTVRENVSFTRNKDLPGKILRARGPRVFGIPGSPTENVLIYTRRITITKQALRLNGFPIEGLNDIMRVNVQGWLSKMDNPKKDLYIIKGSRREKVRMQRNYHVHLILKYKSTGKPTYKAFTLTLNRKGIKDISEIGPQTSPRSYRASPASSS